MSTIADLYPDQSEFRNLLEDAERQADSDFETEFVCDMQERYEQFGKLTYLSPKQHDVLLRIAGWD